MRLFGDIFSGVAKRTAPQSGGWSLAALLERWADGGRTAAGESVTYESASRLLDVYAAVRVRAEAVGSLPPRVFEIVGNGKEEAVNHPLHWLLAVEPNPEMSADVFWTTMEACKALTGNAYAQIVRNGAGTPAAIYPLHPRRTRPVRLPDNSLAYETTDGERAGASRIVASSDILHLKLWSLDGLLGLSPIEHAMQSLGIAIAAEKYGGRFFAGGGRPTGVLSTASTLNDKQQADMKSTWSGQVNSENGGKTAVLWGDWKYTAVGITPEEAQFLETRKYGRTQIAALIGVQPHQIGDTTRLSNANHEQEELSFVTATIRPSITNTQLEVKRKLFPTMGRNSGRYGMEFDLRDRLKADFKTTHEALALGRQWGWYTANHCLYELGENPIGPQGDVLLYPLNMGNAKALLDPSALKPVGAVKPQPVAEPKAEPGQRSLPVPTERTAQDEERAIIGQFAQVYLRLFHDATGRVTAREKRDSVVVAQAFEPVLTSVQEQVDAAAQERYGLADGWHAGAAKQRAEHLRGVEQRAQKWTEEAVTENAGHEFNKAIRAIVVNTARDAAALSALASLQGVEDAA